MGNNVPCKGCEKRHIGCHSNCREYNAWKFERDRKNKIEWDKKKTELEIRDSRINLFLKVRRRMKKW